MEILQMTMKELFKVFGDYSLSSMFGSVYYMDERIGDFVGITSQYSDDYYFVPNKDDPDNIKDYSYFSKEKDLREFFDRKALWFKQIKEQKRTEQLQEDFK